MVSVDMITYKHEAYIAQAIEGVLMQKTDFDFDLVICDDFSPDSTEQIIRDIISTHPKGHLIKYFRHPKNIGMQANGLFAVQQCHGKYIALCEGDDYWTDPHKLQKQVDFLEANSEYVIHSGKAQILKDNKLGNTIGDPLSKKTYDIADFYTKNNLITCTVTFRNVFKTFPDFSHLTFGDWMLYVFLLSQKSANLAFVSDEVYSVYRIHDGGIMQTLLNKYDSDLAHFKQIVAIKQFSTCNYTKGDIFRINDYAISIFANCLSNKNYRNSFNLLPKHYSLTKKKFPIRNYLGLLKNHLFNK